MKLQNDDFFFFLLAHEAPTYSVFTFPVCLKCRMTIKCLTLSSSATSCVVVKRINFYDWFQLVVINLWYSATILLFLKALLSFAKLLEPPLHCTFVSSSWDKCIVDIMSCLCCIMTNSELELKNHLNLFFV